MSDVINETSKKMNDTDTTPSGLTAKHNPGTTLGINLENVMAIPNPNNKFNIGPPKMAPTA
jgi:hypothetical protein